MFILEVIQRNLFFLYFFRIMLFLLPLSNVFLVHVCKHKVFFILGKERVFSLIPQESDKMVGRPMKRA